MYSKYFSTGQLHFQCHRTEAIPVFAFTLCCTATPWALYLKPSSCLIFSAMLHTRENGRVLYLHFNCYPRQGEINGRHRHNHGDLRPRIQQKFRPWPKESPFVTQGPGCTSAIGVTVLTIVITFVSISLRSTFWAPKAGNWHGKAS